ncbi:MAG: DUF1173 domain-containing protein [Piscinibacter sp.]|uniref:DUF1173 domain-containing protein n=1 Tax=Piscinibacter sp. TaxID=1903157 RepID=UPI00259116E0|nr:DUF1173 domain-containing protein [Piscinibacter sp.]MCW5662830.1 DUF1173 domain-containing protein [Piscinibacter sp.]
MDTPAPVYELGGRRFAAGEPGFAEAVAAAHAAHLRPRCLCRAEGIEVYVARCGDGFIVKRMPDTGSRHAPGCVSYEPPAEFSGLGQVLGSAIKEDPHTGTTTLKLDFPLTKIAGRSTVPPSGGDADSVATDGTRLSLRGLLHYLWDQAGLTRWQPGFAGKRSWGTVRRHLLQATENKLASDSPLRARLYVPEVFSVEQREAINARRLALWARAGAAGGKPQALMVLVGEVKEIVPARYGYKAVVKHVPEQGFAIDEQLFRRLERRFAGELSLWGTSDSLRLVMIATFGVSAAGVPSIERASPMLVTEQWLPVENSLEQRLIAELLGQGRKFVKGLRYNLGSSNPLACAVLTDLDQPVGLFLETRTGLDEADSSSRVRAAYGQQAWVWHPDDERMPPLPA